MNTNIALGIQTPDLAGNYMQALQTRNAMEQMRRENAMQQFMAENGQAVISGDQNALAQLAQFDPRMALAIGSDMRNREMEDKRFDLQRRSTEAGMANDAERLNLARQQAAQASAEHAARLSAVDRETALADIDRALAGATQAQTPEQWDKLMSQNEHTKDLVGKFADRDMLVAQGLGLKDALSMGAGPDPSERYKSVGGTLVDLYAEGGPQPVLRENGFRAATPEEAAGFNAAAGQFGPDGKFYPLNPPSGMTVYGPDGNPIVQTGTVGRPLTEGQSKDNLYLTSAQGALPGIEEYESALVGAGGAANAVAGAFPGGGFLQSEGYQKGQQAATEFGAAILRKESGAALTDSDMEWLTKRYIPVPGDKPGVIEQKRISRERAIAGLRSGMSAEQIKQVELASGGVPTEGKPSGAPQVGVTEDGYRFKGGDPSDPNSWEKVE